MRLKMMERYFSHRATREKCHILKMLEDQAAKPHRSFHTPGHKVQGYDITELGYSDNLSCPQSVLLQAERDIAVILGADASFLLTDGSTSGVLSMLYVLKKQGIVRIAAPLLSHKSFFNGCELMGLTPVLFETPTQALPCPLAGKDVQEALNKAEALFITSPDYYGNIANLKEIQAICRTQKKPLIIDGAHGGHLHYNADIYAGAYADMWVDGVHKSLPALTQGAVVSACGQYVPLLKKAVDIFRTTSPSYPIMASIEYAVKYPENKALENRISSLKAGNTSVYSSRDYTKFCLFVKDGYTVERLANAAGLYPEFSEDRVVCFYFSPAQSDEDINVLEEWIQTLKEKGLLLQEKDIQRNPAPIKLENIEGKPTVQIPIKDAEGRLCAEVCGLFPPCTPLLLKGEKITKEKINSLQAASNRFGVENENITVVVE